MTKLLEDIRPTAGSAHDVDADADGSWTKLLDDGTLKPIIIGPASQIPVDAGVKELLVTVDPETGKTQQTVDSPANVDGVPVGRRRESILGTFHRQIRMSLKAVSETPGPLTSDIGFSSLGVGVVSRRGGIRSLIASRPFASANEVILWLGEKPCSALCSDCLPPERAPSGSAPVGVRPFSCSTDSDSSRSTEKTRAILPIARILLRITSLRAFASSSVSSPSQMSSSSEQMLSTLTSISVTFSPTNGSDQVKTSMKFGSQYGWDVEIVGRGEDGDQRGETGGRALPVHAIAGVLRLVRPDNGEQLVVLQEITARLVAVEVRTPAHGIVRVEVRVLLVAEVLERVRPEQITHGAERRRLLEPVQLPDVVQLLDLGRQAAVNTEELLIHERRQRQAVERVHARVVHALRVLNLTLLLKRKVFCQVTTLVVAAQQKQGRRVAELERPQVEDALYAEVAAIDVVAEEEIFGRRRRAADLEQLHQINCPWMSPHTVTGASMSIIVLSAFRIAAPSWMIRKAAFSSIRPSRMKCCFSTSGRGLPVCESNTSDAVSLCFGGKGTLSITRSLPEPAPAPAPPPPPDDADDWGGGVCAEVS
uniref:Uncharacterized protein n=1 Tax=Anopheles atroparvus TaxID=41427 RepID=A0A182J1E9_ANOAO